MRFKFTAKLSEDVYRDFRNKYEINRGDWEDMIKYIRRPKLGKHFVIIWGIPMILIGICMIIALATSINIGDFNLIFTPAVGLFQRFTNIAYAVFLFSINIVLIIFPWFRFADVYKW